ncbi:MAG TPA: FlgT C-terminal domain-containing protein, partial [Myxococcales bacterium]|nr:FlgT C-terminal domain-containing protein [Myxococcales bacterium]
GMFGVAAYVTKASSTINVRFIDSTTAERVVSIAADGSVTSGGGSMTGASLSHDAEWGVASESIQKAAHAWVEKLSAGEYLARIESAGGKLEGKIIKVEGTRAWINLGALSGIKVGDQFNVFDAGEALIDPDTGAKLGSDERQTGSGAVVEVQPKFAVINFTGAAKAKDTIRKR